jgi:hypothetical protein
MVGTTNDEAGNDRGLPEQSLDVENVFYHAHIPKGDVSVLFGRNMEEEKTSENEEETAWITGSTLLHSESARTPALGRRDISAPVEYRGGDLLDTTFDSMKSSALKKRCDFSDRAFREAEDLQGERLETLARNVTRSAGVNGHP